MNVTRRIQVPEGRRLPVGAIDVIHRDGAVRVALHVFCPREVRAVLLEVCSRCEACIALDAGEATGARPTVLCGA
jgi:hypothetical protein